MSDGGGGFGNSSPERVSPKRVYRVVNGIDWSITGDDVEELKSKVVPMY